MAATLLEYSGDRFKAGAVVYARFVVRGFDVSIDGQRCAVLEAIIKDARGRIIPDPDCGPRLYYIPESHLVEGKIVAEETA